MRTSLVVVAASPEELYAWVERHQVYPPVADELVLLDNAAARWGGLATIGNHYLAATRADVLGLIHADVDLDSSRPFAEVALAQPAVTGIVGTTINREYVWASRAGALEDKHRAVTESTAVSTLDSCSIFLPVKDCRALELAFDEDQFPSFHLVVEDFCLAAAERGVPSVVPVAGPCGHRGTRWRQPEWQRGHAIACRTLAAKWADVAFTHT